MEALSNRIFDAMIEDIIFDTVLQSHREFLRSRLPCKTCGTLCGTVHIPSNQPFVPGSPKSTPGVFETGTSTPVKVEGGNIYYACPSCEREIASNRLAPHLSSCLGFANGTRRVTARAVNKPKNPTEADKSATPESDGGNQSDASLSLKAKSKSKSKRTDEAEFNLKRKRQNGALLTSPGKKSKKPKAPGLARVKSEQDPFSLPKLPSKIRAGSTTSLVEDIVSSPSSRHSSPDGSVYSPNHGSPGPATYASRPSPTKPKPVNNVVSKQPILPCTVYGGYGFDGDGDETGSSTDTDAS